MPRITIVHACLLVCLIALPYGCGGADAEAQFARGQAHAAEGDYARAARSYRRAADQGHADAQFHLGQLYERGAGVPQDYAEMLRWMRAAAEQGHREAQFVLGIVYSGALKWGHGKGGDLATWQDRVAGALDGTGVGLTHDDVQAYMWFARAAAQGHPTAGQFLTLLEGRMSASDLAAARRAATDS